VRNAYSTFNGTRETDLLDPVNSVQQIHAIVLAGGSAFGLDAASGVMRYLDERNHDLEPYLGWILAESRRGDPADVTAAGRALSRYDARPFASGLRVPSAVVFTTHDHLVRAKKQRALARAVDARVFDLDGDHYAFWANAKEFADATRQAVDEVVNRLAATPA